MTEPTPHEILEPKSLPENLPPPGSFGEPPNALQEASSRRTTLIAWGLLGLTFVGGVVVMAVSWGDMRAPNFGDLSIEAPRIELPFNDAEPPAGAGNVVETPPPEGMSISEGREAESVGQSDKPAHE